MPRKVIIIAGAALLLLVLGVVCNLDKLRLGSTFFDGQREEAIRGDLVIPVTATGMIEAARLTQIKSKASGMVQTIHVVEGQMVNKGDILVELDPVDEKRTVEAREANLDRSRSALEKMKIVLEDRKLDLPLQTRSAQARVAEADARLAEAVYRYTRTNEQYEREVASENEMVLATTARGTAQAARDLAAIELTRAKKNEDILFRSAQEDVVQAKAASDEAQKVLDEATLRFEETTVRAPSDGMVYSITIRTGEMIQSGTQSLTGGTTLMMLADTNSMFVIAQVDEADIGSIRDIAPKYARPGETRKLEEKEYVERAMKVISAASEVETAGAGSSAIEERMDELEGRPVEVTVEAYRTETFQGVIERMLPEPQRVNNAIAFKVRIRLIGEGLQRLMGHQADLSFKTRTLREVVLVKNEALASEGRDCYVFIPYRDSERGKWSEKKVPVKIGATDGTYTEIISGLDAGQDVWVKRPRKTAKERRAQRKT